MKYHDELAIKVKARPLASFIGLALLVAVIMNRLGFEWIPLPLSGQVYQEVFLFRRWPAAIALGLFAGAFMAAVEPWVYTRRMNWFRQMENESTWRRIILDLRSALFPEFWIFPGVLLALLLLSFLVASITAVAAAAIPFGLSTGPTKRLIAELVSPANDSATEAT